VVGHMPLEHGTLVRIQASQPGFSALRRDLPEGAPDPRRGKAGISFGHNGLDAEGVVTHQDSLAWAGTVSISSQARQGGRR
jgi:hypothetical protein